LLFPIQVMMIGLAYFLLQTSSMLVYIISIQVESTQGIHFYCASFCMVAIMI